MVIKLVILGVLLLGLWWSLSSLEPRTLYYPDRTLVANPSIYRMAYEEFHVKTEDGVHVHGWVLPGSKPRTMLISHGNAGNISHRLDKAKLLHESGASLVFYDYRGYGQSEGTPTEKGTYADAEAVYAYLTQTRGIPAEQIVFYGESLGCAVSTEMALRHPSAGLILESPFTSTVDMAKRIFPWLPVQWIVRYRYDNLSKIPKLKTPLLIMHSPQDEIVPIEMGKRLYEAASQPKTLFKLRGGHNEGFLETGGAYVQVVQEFVRRHGGEGLR